MSTFRTIKRFVYFSWIALVIILGLLFVFRNQYFQPEFLAEWIHAHGGEVWFWYAVISFARGFFLIPSTPFVLLGVVLFPDNPFEVLAISMSGVVFSATLLYFYSDNIGFSKYLESAYPRKAQWMKDKLGGRYRFLFIYCWSIFPPVPTDLICYVAGILKVNYWTMIVGVFLGEFTLNVTYVLLGQKAMELFY